MKKLFTSILSIFAVVYAFGQLSGSYTIGGTGANFATVVQAVDTLNTNGVSGAVVFNIRSGTYTGQVKINNPTGVSSTNTVLFRPDTANTTPVIVTASISSTTNGNRGTWVLNGSKYIEVDSITILGTGTANGHAVEFNGSVNDITFKGCHLRVDTNSSTTSFRNAVVMDNTGSTNQAEDITIEDCTIKGGSFGIYAYGASSANNQDSWDVNNCNIESFYYAGLWCYYSQMSFNDNVVNTRLVGSYFYPYGINLYYSDNSEIRRNIININPSTSIVYGYGMYVRYCDATSSARKIVANNMVNCDKSFYACYFYLNAYMDVVHNTVRSGSGYNSPYTFYHYGGTGSTFRNNICYNSTGGNAYYQIGTTTRSNNNFYTSGAASNVALVGTETTLDPQFVSNTDLHIQNIGLNGVGFNFAGVTTDIDGDTRTATRDVGADEITPDTLDLRLVDISTVVCSGTQNVELDVQNYGLDTIKSAKVYWSVARNSGAPVAQTPYTFSGTIASGKMDTWNLGTYTFQQDSVYKVWAYVDTVNNQIDMSQLNDSVVTDTFKTALNGIYYVGGGAGADFATPLAAVTALKSQGMCGSVTFKVRSGSYNGQLILDGIPGLSSTDTLRFTADTGSTMPIITSAMTSPTLEFDGVSHITFDNLSLQNGSNGGQVAFFDGSNSDITFDSCYMKVDTSSTNWQTRIINKDNRNSTLHRLRVMNSTLVGGYSSIYILGNNTNRDSSIEVSNCKLSQFYYYGIYLQYHEKAQVIGNDIDNTDRRGFISSRTYGAYFNYSQNMKFNLNRVVSGGYLFPYGIYLRFSGGSNVTNRTEVINNMVSLPGTGYSTTSTFYCAYVASSNYTDFMYNNTLVNSGGNFSYATYLSGSGMIARNNNMVNFGGGYAFYRASSAVTNSHNNAHAPNGTRYGGTGTIGASSINIDPEYLSMTDLHVQSISLNSTGISVTGITADYDGDTRATTPDIGADEFTPPANDLRPFGIVSPAQGTCGQDSADLYVLVKNNGTNAQTTQPLTAIVLSPTPDTVSATGSKNIASGQVDTVYLGKINTTVGGNFRFLLISSLGTDQRQENDTLEIINYRIYKSPTVPVVGNNIVVCDNIDTTLVGVTNGSVVRWYDDPNGSPIHEGDSLKVNLNTSDTLWVMASDDSKSRVGIANNGIGIGRNYTVMNNGIKFDVLKNCTIDTVTVYPNDTGTVTVRLLDANNTLLQDTTFSVGSASFAKLPIGFKLTPGKNYVLNANGTATTGMWYTYSGIRYPYVDSDSAVVMTSSQSNSIFQYFFFYDWVLSVEGCESGFGMVPINTRPSLSVNIGPDTGYCVGNTFNHTFGGTVAGATGYRWHNNSTSPTFTATTQGTYFVDVTSTNGCVTRDSVVVSQVPIPTVTFTGAHYCTNQGAISVSGNPSGGAVTGPGAIGGLYYPGVAGPGSHTVTYTYTDSIGCSNSAVGTIVVDTAPNVTLTPPATICQNKQSVTLSGGMPLGGYYYGKNIQGNKILPGSPGIDTVNYVYYALNGCHDTATATVQIISSPTINWGQVADVCLNTPPVNLGASPSGGVYSGNGVSGGQFNPTTVGVGSHKVQYTVSGGNGCSSTEERSVLVLPIPNVNLSTLFDACEHEGDYLLSPYGFPSNGGTFKGSFVDDVKKVFDVQAAGPGTYPITYVVINQHGCKDSASQNLVVNPTPEANFGGDKQICGSQTIILDAKNAGGSYLWSTGETTQTITVTSSGQYVVTITANDCVGIDSVKVTKTELCVGIEQNFMDDASVQLFPNPTSGLLNLDLIGFDGMEVQLSVLSLGGQELMVMEEEVIQASYNQRLDLSDLSNGTYMLRIGTAKGSKVYRFTISK